MEPERSTTYSKLASNGSFAIQIVTDNGEFLRLIADSAGYSSIRVRGGAWEETSIRIAGAAHSGRTVTTGVARSSGDGTVTAHSRSVDRLVSATRQLVIKPDGAWRTESTVRRRDGAMVRGESSGMTGANRVVLRTRRGTDRHGRAAWSAETQTRRVSTSSRLSTTGFKYSTGGTGTMRTLSSEVTHGWSVSSQANWQPIVSAPGSHGVQRTTNNPDGSTDTTTSVSRDDGSSSTVKTTHTGDSGTESWSLETKAGGSSTTTHAQSDQKGGASWERSSTDAAGTTTERGAYQQDGNGGSMTTSTVGPDGSVTISTTTWGSDGKGTNQVTTVDQNGNITDNPPTVAVFDPYSYMETPGDAGPPSLLPSSTPAGPTGDTPAGPTGDTPTGDTPAAPTGDTPTGPTGDSPTDTTPADPGNDAPTGDEHGTGAGMDWEGNDEGPRQVLPSHSASVFEALDNRKDEDPESTDLIGNRIADALSHTVAVIPTQGGDTAQGDAAGGESLPNRTFPPASIFNNLHVRTPTDGWGDWTDPRAHLAYAAAVVDALAYAQTQNLRSVTAAARMVQHLGAVVTQAFNTQ